MHDIACRDCGTTFQARTRHRRYCDPCRRQRYLAQQRAKPPKAPTSICTGCGKPVYRGRGSLPNPTCRDCRRAQAMSKEQRRVVTEELLKQVESDLRCQRCSKPLNGLQAKRGQKYCSQACSTRDKSEHGDAVTCKQCGQAFNAKRDRATYCGNDCRQRALATDGMLRNERTCKWASHLTYSNCHECGALICWKAPKAFCSSACSSRGRGRLDYARNPERFKRAAHRRRARIKEAFVEDVDATKVYERDKWMCHICGKKVRKKPRFPRDPHMASLDHLIPLDLGGAHSYANVACAHLRCNLKKHTSATGEQLMIVGMT